MNITKDNLLEKLDEIRKIIVDSENPDGSREDVLCILLQHKEFYWLADPFIYSVFLTNYKLLTAINKLFLITSDQMVDVDDVNDKEKSEGVWRMKQRYKRIMNNRRRMEKYGAEKPRGAYKSKYTEEEYARLFDFD